MIDEDLLLELVTTMGIVETALKNAVDEKNTPEQVRRFANILKREGTELGKAVDAFNKREAARNTMDLPFPEDNQ